MFNLSPPPGRGGGAGSLASRVVKGGAPPDDDDGDDDDDDDDDNHPGLSKEELHLRAALSLYVWARWWNRKRSCNDVMKKDAFALYIVQGVSKKVGPTALNFSSDFWAPAKILLATLF